MRLGVELLAPVERGRAVVGQQLAGELVVDRLGEALGLLEVGLGGLAPDHVGVGGVGEAAGDGVHRCPPRMRKKPSAVRSPVEEGVVARVDVAGDQLGAVGVGARDEQRRHAQHVGGEARGDEVAGWRFAVGISTLPPMWPHFFSEESWSSKWTPAAPASIIAFISSKQLSGPPKPASASATMGANQ